VRLWLLVVALMSVNGAVAGLMAFPGALGYDASYVVRSDSMEPVLREGDAVVVREVPMAEIDEGDLVVFRHTGVEGTPRIAHRVLEVRRGDSGFEFLTKGDNLVFSDGWINQRDIEGEVEQTVPYLGAYWLLLRSAPGFLLLVLLPLTVTVIEQAAMLKTSLKPSKTGQVK
jgi:signal peptidase